MIAIIILGIFATAIAENIITVPLGPVDINVAAGDHGLEKYHPLNPEDVTASANARRWGEEVIKNVTTKTEYIPILDPFYRSNLPPITITGHPLVSGTIRLKNLKVTGIKNMNLGNTEVRLRNNRYDVTITGPAINTEVDYTADVVMGILPFTYNGHARVNLKGLKASGSFGLTKKRFRNVAVFQVSGMQFAAHADDVKIAIDKALWETISGEMSANELIKEAAAAAGQNILSEVNKVLRNYPARILQQYALGLLLLK